eukprot:scaffold59659_cov36-Prasinocladus_malaysianus.AAC.1
MGPQIMPYISHPQADAAPFGYKGRRTYRALQLTYSCCNAQCSDYTIGRMECKHTKWTPIHMQPLAWCQA